MENESHRKKEEIDISGILRGERIPHSGFPISSAMGVENVIVQCFSVDDDGTFDAPSGNRAVYFLAMSGTGSAASTISTIRNSTSVALDTVYLYRLHTDASQKVRFATFFSPTGDLITAPDDFDWSKYHQSSLGFTIVKTIYPFTEELDIYQRSESDYYFPFIDKRGKFWNEISTKFTEEDPERTAAFKALLGAISRKSAIRSDIRPISLKTKEVGKVSFTFKRVQENRCFSLEIELPDLNQMESGAFFIPGRTAPIREPLQFAAGVLAMLQERAAGWMSMGGDEVECRE